MNERIRLVFQNCIVLFTAFGLTASVWSQQLPATGQLLVSIPKSWDSSEGTLMAYHWDGKKWQASFDSSIPVLYGRNGIAWGRGAVPVPDDGIHKREGDGKAPAGYFRVPKVFGYANKLPSGSKGIDYRQVGKWDAWIDDPKNPYYNKHFVADPEKGIPAWFDSQKMRHGDYAYTWLVEIQHNANPPKPGAGSAIFFHIRRGENRYTSGCTTMKESDLVKVIKWLNPKANPHYVLLPKEEYGKLKGPWNLP